MYSIIIPVYKNAATIEPLLVTLAKLHGELPESLEVVFVIDGSPDQSQQLLMAALPDQPFDSKLISLSRNFGSFSAIRAGLHASGGEFYAFMAADLQEPPSLMLDFFHALANDTADVTIGSRDSRSDPPLSKVFSGLYWWLYRRFVTDDIPPGGVDVFGCNRKFRDHLLSCPEANTSLIGLIFWLGFRRQFFSYDRLPRPEGKSAWTWKRKLKYFYDSVFGFTDLPIRILMAVGILGVAAATLLGFLLLVARLTGDIVVPGYTATGLIILFFAGLNALGLGIIGSYVWRAFENTKARPPYVVMTETAFKSRES